MFPDFPNFFGNLHYFLKGKTLNLFRKALYEQVPIEGAGIILQETNDGIIITSQAGRATTTASVIDFTGTLSGGDVTIRGGKVLGVTSSAGWGHTVGKAVAFGYVPAEEAGHADYEIESFTRNHAATRIAGADVDPERRKILA